MFKMKLQRMKKDSINSQHQQITAGTNMRFVIEAWRAEAVQQQTEREVIQVGREVEREAWRA